MIGNGEILMAFVSNFQGPKISPVGCDVTDLPLNACQKMLHNRIHRLLKNYYTLHN